MIKTVLSMTLAGVIAATIIGCSSHAPTIEEQMEKDGIDARCKQENVLAPRWTCVPNVDGAYAGVGIAQKSAAGMGFMQREALANGRSDLAQQIKSQVKDKVETFTRSTGNGEKETVDKVTTAVSKQIAKVDLQGSKMSASWKAPSGALYLLVTVPLSAINTEVKDSVKTSFRNDEALWQQFQSKNALEELDKEFPTE